MLAVAILIHKSPSYKKSRASLLPPPARHRSLLTGILSQPVLQHFLCVVSGLWSSTKCSRGQVTGPASKQKANANPSHSYFFDPTPRGIGSIQATQLPLASLSDSAHGLFYLNWSWSTS